MLFDPQRLPAPDEYGYFCHPDIPGEDESDDVRKLCGVIGFDVAMVPFEYDAADDLIDAYYEHEDQTAVGRWTPTPPPHDSGNDWQLVAKFDTEDGPYAMFVTPNV